MREIKTERRKNLTERKKINKMNKFNTGYFMKNVSKINNIIFHKY